MRDFIRDHKISLGALALLIVAVSAYTLVPVDKTAQSDPHAIHRKMIAERLAGRGVPEMDLSIEFDYPENVLSGQETKLSWKMVNNKTGEPVIAFERNMEKLLHLIIVNDALEYFDHVHPVFDGSKFTLDYTFPKDDNYRLYLDFQPVGSAEIQKDMSLRVGKGNPTPIPSVDLSTSKIFENYKVSLDSTFKASDIITAKSHFTFTVTDAATDSPIKDLRPYLGAFGHLVMINMTDYSYIHVHPLVTDLTDDRSGPTVEFLPFDLRTGTIEPGRYRLFAQFNPTVGLFTADFVVDIK